MLDSYTREAYTIAIDRHFVGLTLEALYKGTEAGHKALSKMMQREMPNGLLTISCKQDYNKVNWIALSLELEKHFKSKGQWNPPPPEAAKCKPGTVKVNRIVA